MGSTEFEAGYVNSWLAAWQHNLVYAQDPGQGETRRIWARVALSALDGAERAGYLARNADVSRFNLRALLISDLGSADDPLWDPDQLVSDVLGALPLSFEQAGEWVVDWRARPREQILAMRVCKNLLAPLKLIVDQVSDGQVERWLALWARLP
ncbi:hypothetical protein AB0K18_38195 [Nonomuraea sp. NPDC049421]|uniref:hypothetical protein n=1 Tax=Nonomuraea sp. NPDC049421 TaxID=3155275 RepID=UPI00343AD5C0